MNDANDSNDRIKSWFGDSDEDVANWIRGNGQLPLLIAVAVIAVAVIAAAFGA